MKTSIQKTLFQTLALQGHQTAVIAKDGALSYRQLDNYSAGIAQYLKENLAIAKDTEFRKIRIGVCMSRNSTLIPTILAIFRLGATYIPLDPELPEKRKQYIAENAELTLLLTDSSGKMNEIPAIRQLPVDLSQLPENCTCGYIQARPDDCAYVIYTSGTTGNPKGVQISYMNLSTFTENLTDLKIHGPNPATDRYLAFASIGFDVSILELMLCLPVGGTLVVAGQEERKDISLLTELIKKEKVNVAFLPPSLLAQFPRLDFPSLKILLFGAEAINEKLLDRLKQQSYTLIHMYGPTENTVASTARIVNAHTPYDNIGYPLKGITYYVLNEERKRVACHITGELYLGGLQVSPGYIGNEESNQKSFILYHGERLYKTGDLVQRMPDGSIRFIGRKDSQVKIRGFRIELNEIMEHLNKDPEIEKSYVTVIEQNGQQLLGAYLQPADKHNFRLENVKERLRAELPQYMIPNRWQTVDCFRRNINDKIDIRALPPFTVTVQDYTPPVHPGEEILCNILKNILEIPEISVEAHLINDLGLTSLDILKLVAEANEQGCPVTVPAVYTAGTIRGSLTASRQQPIYWYKRQRPEKPVIILVCGAAYFNHLYFQFADRLYPQYDLLVIDAIYDHFPKVATDTQGLLDYYARTVQPLIQGRTVYALTGFCMGGELAVGLAELLRRSAGISPKVFSLDGQAWQNPALSQNYPLLIFPGDSEEMTRRRNEITNTYFRTTPNLIYQGEVVAILSGLFHRQAGISPDEPWTEENYRIFKEEYDNCEKLWNKYYPDALVFRLPADHWTFFKDESLEQLLTFFIPQNNANR